MTSTLSAESRGLIEVRVGGKSLDEITQHSLRMWSESELLDHLQRRLGKTKSEIEQLLESVSKHRERKSYA